jgi:8-oxo-dGTP diphosphatase
MNVRPCAIIIQDNKLLVLKYNYNGNTVYGLPGGNPDPGETLGQTLIRELREELSIDISVSQMALTGEVIREGQAILHCAFLCKIISGEPSANPMQTTSLCCEWLDISNIDQVNMYPNLGKYIQKLSFENTHVYIGKIKQQWF